MGKDFGDLAHVLGDAKQGFLAFVKGVKDDEQARREGRGGTGGPRAFTWTELQGDLQRSIQQRVREMTKVEGAPDLIDRFNNNRPRTAPSKGLQMAALQESFEKAVKIKDAFDFSHLGLGDEPAPLM